MVQNLVSLTILIGLPDLGLLKEVYFCKKSMKLNFSMKFRTYLSLD